MHLTGARQCTNRIASPICACYNCVYKGCLHQARHVLAFRFTSRWVQEKEAELSRLRIQVASLQEKSENTKGLKEVWRRAERAEEKAAVLQQQLKIVNVSSHLDRKASKMQMARKYGGNWGRPPPDQQALVRNHGPQRNGAVLGQLDGVQHDDAGVGQFGDSRGQGSTGKGETYNHYLTQAGHTTAAAEYKPSAEVAALQDVLRRAHSMNRSMLRRAGQGRAAPSVMLDSSDDLESAVLTPQVHETPQSTWKPSIGSHSFEQTNTMFSPNGLRPVLDQGSNEWSQSWKHR